MSEPDWPDHAAMSLEDVPGRGIDPSRNPDVAQPAQPQSLQEQPTGNFSDGSGPLFNMYIKMAAEEDNKMTDRWQKDADGILIFTGLFSASVAALAAVSVQDLRPNSQDTSAFYLKNIYRLLADPNISRAAILASPAEPPPFSPPRYAIWVNSLWFLSLVMSLTCALLATLLQQWARNYLTVTQPPRFSPHKRARIRAFFANGVEKFHLLRAVEMLPALLHLSLFLFFFGLLIFLCNINHTPFTVVACWVGLSAGIYVCITLMPIFCHDSPYYAPLSSSAWFLFNAVLRGALFIHRILFHYCALLRAPQAQIDHNAHILLLIWGPFKIIVSEWTLDGMVKIRQNSALEVSEKMDGRVLKRTFDSLEEDHELERFFEGIPAFCRSKAIEHPGRIFEFIGLRNYLVYAMHDFLERTFSSSWLSDSVKERRFILCLQVADAHGDSTRPSGFLKDCFHIDGVLRSIPLGHFLTSRCHSSNPKTVLSSQRIIAGIIASVPERDDRWKALAMAYLGISEDLLRHYLAHGDSVLLANLIHTARQFVRFYREQGWVAFWLDRMVPTISKFDIRNTLPELQHEFCGLWNEITREAHGRGYYDISHCILSRIRHLYIALHQGTDAAPTAFDASTEDNASTLWQLSSYPLCNIPGHHSSHTSVTSHPADLPATVLNIITSTLPDVPSFPITTPDHSAIIHRLEQSSLRGDRSSPDNIRNTHVSIALPDFSTVIATESPTDTPIVLPTANSESDPRPAAAAPSPLFPTIQSSGTVDFEAVPPSLVLENQMSSLPAPIHSDTLPTDPLTLSASPILQTDPTIPGPGTPIALDSVPAEEITAPRETSVSQLGLARNEATFDNHNNSRTQGPPNIVEVPSQPDQLAMPVLDMPMDPLQDSLDTACRDINRPQ